VGDTANFSISNSKLAVSSNAGSIIGWKDAFGPDQEVQVTLSTIQSLGGAISVGLKAQDTTQCNNLQVRYLPSTSKVQVYACSSGTATQQGADIAVSFAAGDKFGARAKSDGTVQVYKNGTLVGTVTVSASWPYRANGGRIGLGASNASGTVFDDFGGGNFPTPPPASSESYSYDNIGNITSKAGVNYTNPAGGQPRPHTPSAVAGVSYTYDNNGNLLTGGNRNYVWNYDNKPSSVTTTLDTVQETYQYDADTNRVSSTRNGLTTFYLGLWEENSNGVKKAYYQFGGSTVAVRVQDGTATGVTYLHADHLGSVSLATTSSGTIASLQFFDPWGKVKSGGIGQTTLNYTGQRLDGTGLLYYNARMYDPTLGRFVSADTIVPGFSSGSGGGALTLGQDERQELRPLTVDFHEVNFVTALNIENVFTQGRGFWFQLNNENRKEAKLPWGPYNSQSLNRFSYVLNNPIRYIDPTGHFFDVAVWALGGALSAIGISLAEPILVALLAALSLAVILLVLTNEDFRNWLIESVRNGIPNVNQFVDDFIRYSKKPDIQRVDEVARKKGMTKIQRRNFGDYVEDRKHGMGLPRDAQMGKDVLEKWADDFMDGDQPGISGREKGGGRSRR